MSSHRPIDRFIEALHRDSGEELMFESGRTVRLRMGSIEKNLLAQNVRTHQIENLIADVVPVDVLRRFRSDGEVEFPYAAPSGPVMLRSARKGQRLQVSVRPYGQSPQAPRTGPRAAQIPPPGPVQALEPPPPSTGEFVLESPLDNVMTTSHHGLPPHGMPGATPIAVVAGQPAKEAVTPPHMAARPPKLMRDPVASVSPIELELMSQPPELLPLDAYTPVGQAADFPPPPAPLGARPPPREPTGVRVEPLRGDVRPPPRVEVSVAPPPHAGQVTELSSRRSPIRSVPVTQNVVATDGSNKIDPLLVALTKAGGSDLHLTAGIAPLMRKDGDICPLPGFNEPMSSDAIESFLNQISTAKIRAQLSADNDADWAHEIKGIARFRLNGFRDRRGVGAVARVIPADILSAEKLGLPPVVKTFCELDKGLVLVTGPTGSGKSTTLAAMIDLINRTRSDHIITIEDPVEFVHEPKKCLVNQREMFSHTKSFHAALKAALREDPDIVLVGEMRDLETISIALETAETGHLVFGTLHTNTAVSTIDRIIDQFPADRQSQVRTALSESLRGVVAQMLCKKKGGGRVAALEILIGIPAVGNLIREAKTFQISTIMQTGRGMGMQTLNDALMKLVSDGKIEPAEAYRKAVNKNELKALLERSGFALQAA